MKQLNIHTIGEDKDPEEGLDIFAVNNRTDWDQLMLGGDLGAVEYWYPYKYKTLQEAFADGLKVLYKDDEYAFNENGQPIGITINLDENVLEEGTRWMYYYEYLQCINESAFPFQSDKAYDKSVILGLCKILDRKTTDEVYYQDNIKYKRRVTILNYNGNTWEILQYNFGTFWEYIEGEILK
jgi:hypothetical protein